MENEGINKDLNTEQVPGPLPEINTADEDSKAQKKKKLIKIVLIISAVLVLVGIIGSVSAYVYYQDKKTKEREAAEALEKAKQASSKKESSVNTPVPEITWIDPVEVPNPAFFSQAVLKQYGIENSYYRVANLRGGGEIYLVKSINGQEILYYRFKKGSDGKYSFLKSLSDNLYPEDVGFLNATVSIDNQTTYTGITIPEKITLPNGAVFKKLYQSDLFSKIDNTSKVADTKDGSIFSANNNSHLGSSMTDRIFYLKLADSTTAQFSLVLDYFNRETSIPSVTLSGAQNTLQYSSFLVSGCGSYDSTILSSYSGNQSNLSVIGSTSLGDEVYGISNTNSPLAQDIYAVYKEASSNKTLNTPDKTLKELSLDKFYKISPQPVFITRDPLGQYIVFLRNDLKSAGGCGKPVIYLYPEKETNVNVKVGASIDVSIPPYKNGWQVTAYPDGAIKTDGRVWDYLFWEGQGFGMYPEIKSGFVVKQGELRQTLESHLSQLGLNKKEKADFIDFWMSNLPKTPYVRLSWLMTADMNKLAPLDISPKPQTLIRIFLDYEGLQRPISIKPQKLTTIPRKGFTVVEWGGLRNW